MKQELEEECVNQHIDMLQQIINTWKIKIKNWVIISNIFRYNLYGWAMSQKLPVNGFMWYDDYLSDFNEDFIKDYSEDGDKRYFLEVDVEYPEELWSSHKDLPFLAERGKLEKVEKLIVV